MYALIISKLFICLNYIVKTISIHLFEKLNVVSLVAFVKAYIQDVIFV